MADNKDQSNNALHILVTKLTPRLLALVLIVGIVILAAVLAFAVFRNNHVEFWGIKLDPKLNEQLASTRTELENRRLAMKLENAVESKWRGIDVRTYLSNNLISLKVTRFRARDRRAIKDFLSNYGINFHSIDFTDEEPMSMVLMDSPIRANVYDRKAVEGATNADDIDLILRGPDFAGTLLIREGTNMQWDRHDQVKEMDPDIVIIHASALWDNTDDAEERDRFIVLLEALRHSQAHVLCYSRSFDNKIYVENWVQQMNEVFPKDRLHIFRIQGKPKHFRIRGQDVNPRVAADLRKQVKRIIGIIRKSPNG